MLLIPLTGATRFESAMAVRPIARSAHFMVHHLTTSPCAGQLSTGCGVASSDVVANASEPVDNSVDGGVEMPRSRLFLGLVVPKRHARRSVTRTQVKVQIRAGVRRHLGDFAAGDWVVRLRAPIDRRQFPSARSPALAALLQAEIDTLLADAARRSRRAASRPVPDHPGHIHRVA